MTDDSQSQSQLDIADFGFESTAELQHATLGLLKHMQRLGLQVLPTVQDPARILGRLQLPSPRIEETQTTSSATAPPDRNSQNHTGNAAGQAATKSQTNSASAATSNTNAASNRSQVSKPPVTPSRVTVPPISAGDATRYSLPVMKLDERKEVLAAARQQVAGCRACPELVINRKNTVYGEGSFNPRVCFFGEAPGADEDRLGQPFVGRAGQLLTKMIQACTFSREECYIFNTIKCRPPGNRNPTPDEVSNCRGYFEQQLEVLQPEFIVCLGLIAAQALLQTTQPVGRLRGKFHQYKTSKVVVTYHPSYLLRNPDAKRAAWDDLQMLMREMGIDPKTRTKQS